MRNPFVAAAMAAAAMTSMARSAALHAFRFNLPARDPRDIPMPGLGAEMIGHNLHSSHKVAQDKRAALKRRNVLRNRRAHRG